ncbi:helix-turn-helix transcriptional regulator [Timonella sp. A28]|uniref:helix-turn-helix transcriptional regulator n=1 Tax=Timonella sp. A28 TaxID=3442640 RepID=UPI003EB9FC27
MTTSTMAVKKTHATKSLADSIKVSRRAAETQPEHTPENSSPHTEQLAHDEETTRERVMQLIVTDGPINAAKLAEILGLTPAGIRRHITFLEEGGHIQVYTDKPEKGARGRPSRQYVATSRAHGDMPSAYSGIATDALQFLAHIAGEGAVEEFAAHRLALFEEKYADIITAADPQKRVEQLARALNAEGFAASVRPVSGIPMLQLCQGHCPVQDVAAQFPQLCEAEAKLFSKMLGTHTQRLVTLAGGGHVCTTNIPVHSPQGHPDRPSQRNVEGTQ